MAPLPRSATYCSLSRATCCSAVRAARSRLTVCDDIGIIESSHQPTTPKLPRLLFEPGEHLGRVCVENFFFILGVRQEIASIIGPTSSYHLPVARSLLAPGPGSPGPKRPRSGT